MPRSSEARLPRLRVAREVAAAKIRARVENGRQVLEMPLSSQLELKAAISAKSSWGKYNSDLLKSLFDSDAVADEYDSWLGFVVTSSSFADEVADFREGVLESISRLESILGRLELFEEPPAESHAVVGARQAATVGQQHSSTQAKDVFVVHGHDQALKESVARFLERVGMNPIILHEQPSAGRTLIEKFEANSSVGYAVVLMTGDDPCGTESRPRQNVIFELGYFYGRLGRARVAALVGEHVARPSDFQGIAYIPVGNSEWKIDLAKELRAAGFDIDMNRVV